MTLPRVSGAVVIISMALSGCFGAYQVSPDDPLGAGGLKATQEDKDAGRVGIATGFSPKNYPVIAGERFAVAKSEIEDEGDQRFADRMATFYQSELVRRLRETGLFSRVVNLSETDFPPAPAKRSGSMAPSHALAGAPRQPAISSVSAPGALGHRPRCISWTPSPAR
jgi:hypothetical protein